MMCMKYAIRTCSGLKYDMIYDDVYTLHVKRITFKNS
jgi:hypothetical protein